MTVANRNLTIDGGPLWQLIFSAAYLEKPIKSFDPLDAFSLDLPIFEFPSNGEKTTWTLRHAVEGVQIFGGIGSGKTSGPSRMLALKYLKLNFGGLVLTVKPDEKDSWIEYCRITGREKDLIIIEPNGKYNFNFLDYESAQATGQSAITDNIVDVLKTVIRASKEKDSGHSDDAFWETALDMLIFNLIDLCKLAYGKLSVQMMYDIAQTIPKADEKLKPADEEKEHKAFQKAMSAARSSVQKQYNTWFKGLSDMERDIVNEDDIKGEAMMLATVPDARLFRFLDQFFMDSFKNLSEKTRSIIDFTFSGFLFRLLREPVYSLFCNGASNITPEDSLDGKIILINLPVKMYHKVGRDCQILFKYIWQRAMEKRDTVKNGRPVFLFADEAQNFIHEHDADFQATARSSRIPTVYITQNLPNYYASMGGETAHYKVKSFLGTLATKIFNANADIETNQYASELIGEAYVETKSKGVTVSKDFSQNESVSFNLERMVRPEEFVRLRTGGERNVYRVEGILHRQGDPMGGGYNYAKIRFDQTYRP